MLFCFYDHFKSFVIYCQQPLSLPVSLCVYSPLPSVHTHWFVRYDEKAFELSKRNIIYITISKIVDDPGCVGGGGCDGGAVIIILNVFIYFL